MTSAERYAAVKRARCAYKKLVKLIKTLDEDKTPDISLFVDCKEAYSVILETELDQLAVADALTKHALDFKTFMAKLPSPQALELFALIESDTSGAMEVFFSERIGASDWMDEFEKRSEGE